MGDPAHRGELSRHCPTRVILTPMLTGQRDRFDATVVFNRPICREHFLLRLRLADGFPPTTAGQFIQLGCRPPGRSIDDEWLADTEQDWSEPRLTLRQPELCAPWRFIRRPFSLADRGDDPTELDRHSPSRGWRWDCLAGPIEPKRSGRLDWPSGQQFCLARRQINGSIGGRRRRPATDDLLGKDAARSGLASGRVCRRTVARSVGRVMDRFHPTGPRGTPVACVQEFSQYGYDTVITTDDGSYGVPGRITSGLERLLQTQSPDEATQTVIYTCGPERMMQAVADVAASYRIDCQVCLEQSMACGMGTCQSCVVKIEDRVDPQDHTPTGRPWRYRLTCTDGPSFRLPTSFGLRNTRLPSRKSSHYTRSLGDSGRLTLNARLPLCWPRWPMYFRASPTISVNGAEAVCR